MSLQAVNLKNGQKILLPSGTKIKTVVVNGNIALTSSCNNLPPVTTYKCWRFSWEKLTTGDTDSAPFNDSSFISIEIGGTKYDLLSIVITGVPNNYNNGGDFLSQAIPRAVPAGLVVMQANAGGTAVATKCIVIKTPATLPAPILHWKNPEVSGLIQWSSMEAEPNICDCTTASPLTNP